MNVLLGRLPPERNRQALGGRHAEEAVEKKKENGGFWRGHAWWGSLTVGGKSRLTLTLEPCIPKNWWRGGRQTCRPLQRDKLWVPRSEWTPTGRRACRCQPCPTPRRRLGWGNSRNPRVKGDMFLAHLQWNLKYWTVAEHLEDQVCDTYSKGATICQWPSEYLVYHVGEQSVWVICPELVDRTDRPQAQPIRGSQGSRCRTLACQAMAGHSWCPGGPKGGCATNLNRLLLSFQPTGLQSLHQHVER